ncbi:MAG TPA: hypothetical protein VMM15_41705 [Bradyrhizobium sp.]|nr:hypothetical protein [Bradyrhizobium sp.]
MGHPKVTIGQEDFPQWGKLVKSWATGRNYVDYVPTEENPVPTALDMPPKYPKPKSFGEFWDQCKMAQVGLVFDDGNNTPVPRDTGMGLIVLQGDSDVFIARVPPEEILKDHEARLLLPTATYPFPQFYTAIYGVPPRPDQMDTRIKRMTIHAERVGEYTLNTCA